MKIINIYPSQMKAHLQAMVVNNDILFLEFDSFNIFSGSILSNFRKLYSVATSNCRNNVPASNRNLHIIFHSAHFPKSWLFMLAAAIFFPTTLVVWGGEFLPRTGIMQFPNKFLRYAAVRCLKNIVFLSASDERDANDIIPARLRRHFIHYYHPSYMRPFSPPSRSRLRVQIGNSGEASNGHLECIALLGHVQECDIDLVIPLGYHLDKNYGRILDEKVKNLPVRFESELIFSLLNPDEFDELIDSCDALLVASKRQRALFSIYRYVASGRPVFLPRDAVLKRDLEALGFEIQALEDLAALDAAAFRRLCRSRNTGNIATAQARLSLDAIRSDWQALLTSEGRARDGV